MALDPTHSSVSPARCRVCAQPCHACMPTVLIILLSLFSPSFSLSEWVSGLSVVPQARWTYTVLQLTCFHKCPTYSPEKSLLPTAYFACQSHLQQLLLKFNFLTVNIRDAAAVLSHDRLLVCCQNFWISHYGKLESLPSYERECTSCQLRMIFRYGSQLLHLINLAHPPDACAHAPCKLSLELLSTFNGMWPYNEQASLTPCQIPHPRWRKEGDGGC